jgi:hypothetical protein
MPERGLLWRTLLYDLRRVKNLRDGKIPSRNHRRHASYIDFPPPRNNQSQTTNNRPNRTTQANLTLNLARNKIFKLKWSMVQRSCSSIDKKTLCKHPNLSYLRGAIVASSKEAKNIMIFLCV